MRHSHTRQSGIVSIFVTMIMMVVISLIVLGFAQVSRREQRQSLDRQLSAQAFFAAESGVNDVRSVISKLQPGQEIPEKTDCATNKLDIPYGFDPKIDGADVQYTCLLVTGKLKTLTASLTAAGNSINMPFQPDGGLATTMHIVWRSAMPTLTAADINSCNGPTAKFTNANNWQCPFGVLRLDIVPTDDLSRTATVAAQKTLFLYPSKTGGGTQNYASSNGAVAAMKCTLATNCVIDITNLNGGTNYALRLSALYQDGSFDISAPLGGGGNLDLKNAQVQVDATGRAQDVLRRIQVRLPLAASGVTPDYAIESGSAICKRFFVDSDTFNIPGDMAGAQDQNNPMCRTAAVAAPVVPVDNTIACTKRGANKVRNGDFSLGAGTASTVNPVQYGFSSLTPNRGPNQFPDDDGINGVNSDTKGWGGGISALSTAGTYAGGLTFVRPFTGDGSVSPSVASAGTSLYTNTNQSLAEPKGTDHDDTSTFRGPTWQTTVTGLIPNTKYDFSGYFASILTPQFFALNPDGVNATIGLTIDSVFKRAPVVLANNGSQWQRITMTYTTGPAQTTALLAINNPVGIRNGTDYAMTQVGFYECQ